MLIQGHPKIADVAVIGFPDDNKNPPQAAVDLSHAVRRVSRVALAITQFAYCPF
jgi:acyl-coenzyme A synthetase/AMP-(fatty) acid ligase